MTTAFSPRPVSYFEDRADGGFAWTVAYDLGLTGTRFRVDLRIDLVGDDPGPVAALWETGAEAIWNQKLFFSDGNQLHELFLDVDFVDSGAHQVVTVYDSEGRDNMSNWYLDQPLWGQDYLDEIASHEIGHMLGAFDEYAGGGTYGGFTTTGTLMSDLSIAGFENYVFGIEYQAKILGDTTLETVLARRGGTGADVLSGTAAMDGIYALAGNDRIEGQAGNDFLDGGAGRDTVAGGDGADTLSGASGNDRLDGGRGSDRLLGGAGRDMFVFKGPVLATEVDTVQGFSSDDDRIALDNAQFRALGLRGDLAEAAFRRGTLALDGDDRILFDRSTGTLRYDPDGKGGSDAVLFARFAGLDGGLSALHFDII